MDVICGRDRVDSGEFLMLNQLIGYTNRSLTQPLFPPHSPWTPPRTLPNLRGASVVGIDLETCDPNLMANGPGDIRGDGFVAGISIATPEHGSTYIPLRHPETMCEFTIDQVRDILDPILNDSVPIVGANIAGYDLGWLRSIGIDLTRGNIHDIQIIEPLIDENKEQGYSLDALAREYVDGGKKDIILLDEALQAYGLKSHGDMWRLPAKYVGPYAEADAMLPVLIWKRQMEILKEQDLMQIYDLERQVVPVVVAMRERGVAVNLDRADDLNTELKQIENSLLDQLMVNPWSGQDLAKECDRRGLWYPRTEAGNPSFEAGWLESREDDFFKQVLAFRKVSKMRGDFIEGNILGKNIKGRLHAQFHQLRKDSDGTRTGRFSSSNPNMQQVPSRDPYWGPLIRGLFVPDTGALWCKNDYSQQEPRLFVHYAALINLTGAAHAVAAFHNNPRTDYHQMTAVIANIERRQAKTINLGLSYGMGVNKLARELGCTVSEAKVILEKYHTALPFVRGLINACDSRASKEGAIRTLLGRRRRFNLWEPTFREKSEGWVILPLDEARKVWPNKTLKRAGTYKAVNALIQGSAADQTKRAMVDLFREGIVPQIQVHDEINVSVVDYAQANMIKNIMENAVKLRVPVISDVAVGPSWGEAVKI